jgi:hypothetical protein
VAGFISEWWPTSNRNGGRHQIGIPGRIASEFAKPDCCRPTLGPRMGEPGFMNLGVAAHIKAASEGGARYDKGQTQENRRSFSNGIWLCQAHAHQVDHDEEHFTVEMLEKWKRDAELRAFDQLTGNGRRGSRLWFVRRAHRRIAGGCGGTQIAAVGRPRQRHR